MTPESQGKGIYCRSASPQPGDPLPIIAHCPSSEDPDTAGTESKLRVPIAQGR